MIGYVSQLCHAIAVSLMCANDNTSLCEYTGDSFRDLTRIARINDKMWAELFLWNKENLISEIDQMCIRDSFLGGQGAQVVFVAAEHLVDDLGVGVAEPCPDKSVFHISRPPCGSWWGGSSRLRRSGP